MISCEEFVNKEIINNINLSMPTNDMIKCAQITVNNEKLYILTPELLISPYNYFSTHFKYGAKNDLHINVSDDKGMKTLLSNVLLPLDELFEKYDSTSYCPIGKGKKNIKFKIYDMKLTVIDKNNNVSETIINKDNIDNIR